MTPPATPPALPPRAQAMILAAGRGARMQPLTDHTPKPLLPVHGKPLLQWHLEALQQAGVGHALINTGWLGEQIAHRWGNGLHNAHGRLHLQYSREDLDFGAGIETAGGIARALPRLEDTFWLVAGDAFMPGWQFDEAQRARFGLSTVLAHLWLVPNPEHHPQGDFGLAADGLAINPASCGAAQPLPQTLYTYSGLALLRRELFQPPWCDIPAGNPQGVAQPLAPLLRKAMDAGRVSAELYRGPWVDVGTPARLAAVNAPDHSHHYL